MKEIHVFNVRIDGVTAEEARERALSGGRTCTVVTPNALMLEACRRDSALAALLSRATLSLPDGAGVLRAARRKGEPLPARVSGIDFGEGLLEHAAAKGMRVFFLGGADGVAERAAERLEARYPGLFVCGCHGGYGIDSMEREERLLSVIRACRPDILFVCLGFPLQERWIFDHLPYLTEIRVIAGLGGSLDVWAGDLSRAPRLLRRVGLEWAWRMLRQPRRLAGLPSLLHFALCRRRDL